MQNFRPLSIVLCYGVACHFFHAVTIQMDQLVALGILRFNSLTNGFEEKK